MMCRIAGLLLAVGVLVGGSNGCSKDESGKERGQADAEPAVLYTSVDETFARQVIEHYQRSTGRKVTVIGDSEAGKTTGLVTRIRMEKEHPRADVFWSSEQSQTVLLAQEGLLGAYRSASAEDIPAHFKDSQGLWAGFAARARVLAFVPDAIPEEGLPASWEELGQPGRAKHLAIANPLFGTTRGHMAAMHALWGEERFRAFLSKLVDGGAIVTDGNSMAVRELLAGKVALACTDSDDVITARAKGHNVEMIFPDMGDGGTMLIPNTVALVKGARHAKDAKLLIDFLLSAEVEEMLALSESGNYPVRESLSEKLGVVVPEASEVSYEEITRSMDPAVLACREILLK